MGKLLFTNNENWNKVLNKKNENSGFKPFSQKKIKKNFLNVYKKLSVDSYNYYEDEKTSVWVAGTIIYKGKIGEEALKMLCKDYIGMSVNDIRKNCLGSFVLALKKDDLISVVCDEMQTYNVYYLIDNDNYIINNHFYHIQLVAQKNFNSNLILQSINSRIIIDNRTPFDGIYKLQGKDCIVIDLKNSKASIENIGVNTYFDQSSRASIDEALDAFKEVMSTKINVFPDCGLCMTGGFDSRVMLSANINVADNIHKITMVNWTSKDESMVAYDKDTEVCREISQKYGIDLIVKDLTNGKLINELSGDQSDIFDKFGELALFHNGNRNYHKFLENHDLPIFLGYGAAGEILNSQASEDHYRHNLDKYIEDWYLVYTGDKILRNVKDVEKYKQDYFDQWKYRADYIDILDINNLSKDDCDRMYNIFVYSENMDHNNMTNFYRYSFVELAQKKVYDAINSIEHDDKLLNHCHLMFINHFEKGLLDIPIVSHRKNVSIDKTSLMVKKETKGVTKSGIKNKIKEFPVLGKVMKELAYYLRWFVPHDKRPEDRKMRVILTKMCKNEEMFKKMNTSLHLNTFTEIPYFSAFYLYLRMLKELKR